MFAKGRIRRGGSLVTASSRFLFPVLLFSTLFLFPQTAPCINPHATLDDLKKLEILCYVPSYLPKGFRLRSVTITYDEPGPDEWSRWESSDIDGQAERPSARGRTSQGSAGRFPLYSIEYGNGPTSPRDTSGPWSDRTGGATFTIESAREGIGDRNIMETEDSEETQIKSPFGPMYLIYTPKTASSGSGRKVEIKANWASDANMKREKAEHPQGHPILGRYHGFSATAIRLDEFEKIIASLHPIRP